MVSQWAARGRIQSTYHTPMKPIPDPIDPLDRAIVGLLRSLPVNWGDYDRDSLTATEGKALRLMQLAGLVECLLELRATMEGRAEVVEITCIITRAYFQKQQIWNYIYEMVPEWLDEDNQARGRPQIEMIQMFRLSHLGENAKLEFEKQTSDNPSGVCEFVRLSGDKFSHRTPVLLNSVVKSCRVLTGQDAGAAPTRLAAVDAQAAVGGTTIDHTARNNGGEVPEGIRAATENPAAPTAPGSNAPSADGGRAGDGGGDPLGEASKAMKPAVRKAGASFRRIEAERPHLSPPEGNRIRYTKEQWSYIREHYDDLYPLDELMKSTAPNFEAWSRYVREYLRLTAGPKNSPRGGRQHGGSVVKQTDLDQSRRDADD